MAIVVDYAHNESGLTELLMFSRSLVGEDGCLIAIIGTAGDREDDVLVSLGRIAGTSADRVYIKENPGYLRGRDLGTSNELMRNGMSDVNALPGRHLSRRACRAAGRD